LSTPKSPIATNPSLLVKEIQDTYLRLNFEKLSQYFTDQNQLLDFKFYELAFAEAETGFSMAHGLGYIPQDIIITKMQGSGTVTFDYANFDGRFIRMDASGPCRIRFFVGTYYRYQGGIEDSTGAALTQAQQRTVAYTPFAGGTPPGTITAWVGGYFKDGVNGNFTNVLGNTVLEANTYLNPFAYYVCNGALLNDKDSPIWNKSNRYLPNLTDERFLAGSTAAGVLGGDNSMTHTHGVTSNVTATAPAHYHATGAAGATFAVATHTPNYTADTGVKCASGTTYAAPGVTGGNDVNSQPLAHTPSGSLGLVTGGVPGNATMTVSCTNNAVTTSSISATENRPLYLSCFYIVRVK